MLRHRLHKRLMLAGLTAWMFLIPILSPAKTMRTEPAPLIDIVLVHGAFADGSSWSNVIVLLQRKGYHVTAVQNPLSSLAADVAATSRVIARQPHPVPLVGHSWGGAVISQAGNQEQVKGLVYLSALAPDSGESVAQALQRLQAPMQGLQPDRDGLIWLDDPKLFAQVMAHDVAVDQARALAAVQQPMAASAFAEPVRHAAWHDKPSWYLVTQGDRALPTAVQRQFAAAMKAQTETIVSSHLSLASHPRQVADLIDRAARSLH